MTPKRAIEILKDEREGYRTYRPYMTHSALDIMHALDRGVEALLAAEAKRLVDIDKVCEWLESHFRDIENPDFYSKRNHPTELESMYHWSVKELVDDFRKAMEEE